MKPKKELNFDINLISFIGLLAVCICFLLLTAIWIHIASIDVRQTFGSQSVNEQQNQLQSAVWAKMLTKGKVILMLQNPPAYIDERLHSYTIQGLLNEDGILKPNYEDILSHLEMLIAQIPGLSTGLVIPYEEAKYEDVIGLMDQFKEVGLTSLGVSLL